MSTFVIGLGGNLGSRLALFRCALDLLESSGDVQVQQLSAVYDTTPIGPPQPRYLNAAVRVSTGLSPTELLERTLGIEGQLGRERRVRWGERTIDLDLLWSDTPPLVLPNLQLPHPRLMERAFALAPLIDVLDEPADVLVTALDAVGGAPGRALGEPAPMHRCVRGHHRGPGDGEGGSHAVEVDGLNPPDAVAHVLTLLARASFPSVSPIEARSVELALPMRDRLEALTRAVITAASRGFLPRSVAITAWDTRSVTLCLLGRQVSAPGPKLHLADAELLAAGDRPSARLAWNVVS